jgi:hypothetical protein
MIRAETRIKIKGFLEGFLEAQLQQHKKQLTKEPEEVIRLADAKKGKLKPFHLAILPPEAIRIFAFERSFSTSLGTTFEGCAKLIALDNHKEAERSKELVGKVSTKCLNELERVRSVIDGGKSIDFLQKIKAVIAANDAEEVPIRTITDLYLKTKSGKEFYFEIKSPKPNKGQAIEVTDRLLRTQALRRLGPPRVNTYFAMAYNPYGVRVNYKHSFAVKHLDMKNQILLQDEFWDIVGGKGTFTELLEIYREVGKEKGRQVMDQLAYDGKTSRAQKRK